jgi:hypothetical protein
VTTHYGKRNAGGLTASSPGDTLYIPLQYFNDSGASISIGSTLAVTDIEVFKDGSATQRATDSGYAILGDTGNFDDRIGFKGISIQLFNTSDDASFYAAGSTYWVAIDNVTVDARTVRHWAAIFEIGEPRANVVQIDGDTGSADVLAKTTNGVGGVSFSAGINVNSCSDTGLNNRLDKIQSDTDTGIDSDITAAAASVTVTAFSDTGVNNRLAVILADTDTGIQSSVSVTQIIGDTGAANQLQHAFATTPTYFQQVDVQQMDGDTGAADVLQKFADTTGALSPSGELDTGSGTLTVTAALDTGQVNQAVWQANAVRGITAISDTGINNRLSVIVSDTDTGLKTVPAAIKAKTDSLTFTVTNQVDANIQSVNDVTVTGTGASGDEWGP